MNKYDEFGRLLCPVCEHPVGDDEFKRCEPNAEGICLLHHRHDLHGGAEGPVCELYLLPDEISG